ncbi:response regulator [Sorangium sp. So ce1389]|uniref:response regulator n=1 Tax=Sorangium sp. So ce1389 TaxID=3133336 RepID=UPI003F5DCE6A
MSQNTRQDTLILVIEDDPDILQVVQDMLEEEHFLVVTARDGGKALRMLQIFQPDLILTDMMMPEVDGFAFLRAYLERPGLRAPVIAMSSLQAYLQEASKLGAAATLEKPLSFEGLMETIRALSAGRSVQAEAIPRSLASLDEARRLQTILDLRLEEPAPEPALSAFTDKVARHFGVPISLVSVVTQDRQFWTAGCGLPEDLGTGTPRQDSFCTHAVSARAALVVQDAVENPFFRDNVLVKTRGLRFYAGVPLIARHGEAVGTLCLLDFKPRRFSYFDLELLTLFSHSVLSSLEWREKRLHPEIPDSAFLYLQHMDQDLDIFGKAVFSELAVVEGSRAAEYRQPVACVALAVPARRLPEVVGRLKARPEVGILGRLGHARLGWLVPGLSVDQARAAALEAANSPHAFAEAVQLERYAGAIRTGLFQLELALGDAGLA